MIVDAVRATGPARATWLIPVIAGAGTANIWFVQPLLPTIGAELAVPAASMTIALAAGQWAYAAGQITVGAAARWFSIRQVLLSIAAALALANLVAAFAWDYWVLVVLLVAIGALATGAPLFIAVATEVSPPKERATAVGRVIAGLVLGGGLSRLVSGSMAELFGWRSVFVGASALAVASLVGVAVAIPPQRRLSTVGGAPVQILTSARAALFLCNSGLFAASGIVWAFMPYLLSAPPHSLPPSVIGLVGLATVAGAGAAYRGGALADRRGAAVMTCIAAGGALAATVVLTLAAGALLAVLAAVTLLEVAVFAAQPAILSVNNDLTMPLRGTANALSTVFSMSGAFFGVLVGGWCYSAGGWSAATSVAGAFALGSLVLAGSIAPAVRRPSSQV